MQIEGYSISPQQARIWQLQEKLGPLRAVAALSIQGSLDEALLRKSISWLVASHDIFRTSFVVPAGLMQPLQVISDQVDFESIPRRDESWEDLIAAEIHAPVKPGSTLYPRTVIVPIDANHHVLVFSAPGLCCDGWNLNRLAQDLGSIYETLANGQEPDLEPAQYTDFADWLEELEEEEGGFQLFWDEQLALADWTNPLSGFQRNEPGAFAFDRILLDPSQFSIPKDWSQTNEISWEVFWQTCWRILLCRFSGSSQQTLGVAFHGRSFEELELAYGPFNRFIPFTLSLPGQSTFLENARLVAHQSKRFEQRQDYYKPGNKAPLMGFEWQEQRPVYEAGQISFSVLDAFHVNEPFALKLVVSQTPDGFVPVIEFCKNTFQASFVKTLADHLAVLVNDISQSPEKATGQLEVLPSEARLALLAPGNQDGAPLNDPVHRLFEARAAQDPEKTALVFEGPDGALEQSLTFRELNARSNQLARRLRELGAGPDRLVGLCLDRSIDLIISMLAALKCGSGYIPMDPNTPPGRLSFMVEDSTASVFITDEQHAQLAPNLPTVVLPEAWEALEGNSKENLDVRLFRESLAYCIYTSGSTGQPKAVGVSHGNLLHYLSGIHTALSLKDGDSYAVVSTLAADLGNTSIYPALCFGGTLHLLSGQHITDGHRFGAYFQKHGVDCLKITPSHLASLMSMDAAASVLPQKKLVLGGEATRPELLEEIRGLAPQLEIYNHYGPSETTIGTLTFSLHKDSLRFPMGQPLPQSAVYALNEQLEPVPSGAPGEAYIAGHGVTRGYVGKPALTAERFVPNPFTEAEGARMYRTGDLIRFDGEGNRHFLGRVDHQVKLRGFRIELGEIEALLREVEGVEDALVVLKPGTSGDDRLVAYVVRSHPKTELGAHELRSFLSERLSDYMVPAAYVTLDRFPLNPNGKIDRKALPEPTASAADHAAYVAPQTESEHMVAEIWQELLDMGRIGANDQFFELGGHSFLAIRTLAALKERTGLDLEVRSLLENPKLADFAAAIDAARKTSHGSGIFDPCAQGFPLEVRSATLGGEDVRLWFGDKAQIQPLVSDSCPLDQLPDYILDMSRLAEFDGAEDKESQLVKALGLEMGSKDPHELAPSYQSPIEATRQALNAAFEKAEDKHSYMAGHHPSWFVKRGIRTLNFAEFQGRRGVEKSRILKAVNGFIQKQGLLRAVLTRGEDENCSFVEASQCVLPDIPEFDLSGYHPETRNLRLSLINYLMGQDLLSSDPPLDVVLYNVALVRMNHTQYRVLFAMDHIIADYEAKHVVRRYLQHLDEGSQAQPPAGEVTHYRQFPMMQARLPEGDPKYQQVKQHPYYLRYREPVLKLQEKHPIGEAIVFSKPHHLEMWLEPGQEENSEDNYLGYGLAIAAQVISAQFKLEGTPLRVLVSRRYFSGYNFYNTIGDFHDSVPIYLPAQSTPARCFRELRETDQAYADAGLDLTAVGGETEIYHSIYKSPFNFNFVGEISEEHEKGMLASAGVFSFVSYPIFAYHIGHKMGLIFYHGMEDEAVERAEHLLKSLCNPYQFNRLPGREDKDKA